MDQGKIDVVRSTKYKGARLVGLSNADDLRLAPGPWTDTAMAPFLQSTCRFRAAGAQAQAGADPMLTGDCCLKDGLGTISERRGGRSCPGSCKGLPR